MKRVVVITTLALLAGAIINVLVAWNCEVFRPIEGLRIVHRYPIREVQSSFERVFGEICWDRFEHRGNGSWHYSFGASEGHELIYPLANSPDSGNEFWGEIDSIQVGWPLKSMHIYEAELFVSGEWTRRNAPGILVDEGRNTETILDDRRFPLVPLWPGFLINTMIYGLISWLAICGPGIFRRYRRCRLDQCEACGYPIGTSEVCTECGRDVRSIS